MIWVGILGSNGLFEEALSKLVAGHRSAQISTMMDLQELGEADVCTCRKGEARPGYWSMVNAVKKSDIIFNGLSGSIAEDIYSKALSYGKRVIDISNEKYIGGDLKGKFGSAYPGSVYGLSELYKGKMKDASIAANPSSYCIGAILGLAPLAAGNLVDIDTVAIESKSGITSLRRNDKLAEADMIINGGKEIYKIEGRDYAEEVNEQIFTLFGKRTSASFSAYIIPGIKGIITTIKVKPYTNLNESDISDIYRDFYMFNPLIEICSNGFINETMNGFGKRFCRIKAYIDENCGKIIVTTVLDDALRGAASQAIQTMNLMCGIDGKIGL